MNIHLIAIGGAIMHQIALTEARKGHRVTGSDDVIQEPSRSRLLDAGILPEKIGFFAENITSDIDLVILGMHAKFDNPELTKAMELGLKVLSFPEFIYENSQSKTRVVIAGSHGKTSITSMVMHCLRANLIEFDYLVGSSVAGFDYSVKLSEAPIIVIEGDEYLASPLNKEPKFIYYHAHIATISGIEWDHINVFKTEEIYNEQFKKLVRTMESNSKLFYFNDEKVASIVQNIREDITLTPYSAIEYVTENEQFLANTDEGKILLSVFGKHNMENIQAAKHICNELGMVDKDFWASISSFEGAGRRLELMVEDEHRTVYKDFAHSPSKLKATIDAVKEKYASRHVVACFELHTFSTLTTDFLPQYRDTMHAADTAIIYIDKEVLEKKGNNVFTHDEIITNFNRKDILFFTDIDILNEKLNQLVAINPVYLMMSSGTFSGIDFKNIGRHEKPFSDNTNEVTTITELQPNLPENSSLGIDKKSMMVMFILSYFGFILAPLFYYYQYQKTTNDQVYNTIVACINFQVVATLLLIISLGLSQYTSIGFLAAWIFNIYYTHRAIQNIEFNQSVDIPQSAMVIVPRVNYE